MTEQVPLEMVEIEDDGLHLIITLNLNNKKARLLLDTGASKTVFDEKRLSAFMDKEGFTDNGKLSTGLGTSSMQSKVALIDNIGFEKIVIENYEVAVLDLSHVNESYEKLEIEKIDGVIGGDLLERLNAVIDYPTKKMIISASR